MLVLPKAERPFAKGPYLVLLVSVIATEPWRPDTYFSGAFDSVVVLKATLSVLGLVGAWLLARRRSRLAVPAWPPVLIGLYLACTVFGGWAHQDLLASSTIAVRVGILVLTLCTLLSGYDGYSVMAGLVGALATVGAFSVITAFGQLRDGRLAGGLPPLHPNEVASICAIVIIWLVYRAVNGRESLHDLVALAIAGAALLASGSRTSLGMLAPALLILIVFTRRIHLRVLIPFLVVLPFIVATLVLTDEVAQAATREGSTEDITSLSNRTIAWQAALAPKDSPWLSWLGGGLAMKRIEVPGQWWSHQILDSSWVSALVQSGYIGLGLTLLLVCYGLYRIAQVAGELRGFRLAIIIFLGLRGLLESGLFDASTAFLTCFASLALPAVAMPRRGPRGLPHIGPNTSEGSRRAGSMAIGPQTGEGVGGGVSGMKRRLLIAGNLLALGLAIAGSVNFFAPREYESTATLYAMGGGRQLRASDVYQGTLMVSARMSTYVQIATSPVVLSGAIEELSLGETPSTLASRVTAVNPADTTVLEITAVDRDPAQAQSIAAAVAGRFIASVQDLESGAQAPAEVNFRAVGPAAPPLAPSSPHQLVNLGLGAAAGGALGLLVLLWPLLRIVSSPSGQLRVVVLGPLASRLDASAVRVLGDMRGTNESDDHVPRTVSIVSAGANSGR